MKQRHLHFGMYDKVKLHTPLHSHMLKIEKRNPSSIELNEKRTFMELMLNM